MINRFSVTFGDGDEIFLSAALTGDECDFFEKIKEALLERHPILGRETNVLFATKVTTSDAEHGQRQTPLVRNRRSKPPHVSEYGDDRHKTQRAKWEYLVCICVNFGRHLRLPLFQSVEQKPPVSE